MNGYVRQIIGRGQNASWVSRLAASMVVVGCMILAPCRAGAEETRAASVSHSPSLFVKPPPRPLPPIRVPSGYVAVWGDDWYYGYYTRVDAEKMKEYLERIGRKPSLRPYVPTPR